MEYHLVAAMVLLGLAGPLSGKEMKVTTIEVEPYTIIKNGEYTGFIPDLMEKIGKEENIQYKFHTVKDNKYGSLNNGQWSGMIGEVIRGEADIAAASMTISDQRKGVVAMSNPFMSFGTTILIKKPKDGDDPPIKTIQELADQTDIGYGSVKDGETERFFKSAAENPYKKMYEYMSSHPDMMVNSIAKGIEKVRSSNGKYAFIIEGTTAKYWRNKDPCDLVQIGETFNPKGYGMAISKNDAETKKKLDRAILKLKEDGTVDKLQKKWWNTGAKCNGASNMAATDVVFCLTMGASLLLARLLSR